MQSLTKQGFDSFILTANFSNNTRAGDTIVLATSDVSAKDKEGADATSAVLDQSGKAVSGTKLQIRVQAGTQALSPFVVTFKAKTALGDQWEKDVKVRIKEIE